MKKFLLFLFIFSTVVPIILLGYYGFIPKLSAFFKSDQPRDLNIKFSQQDINNANIKNGVTPIPLTDATSGVEPLRYQGQQEVKTSFTSAELTAINNSNRYIYKPWSNLQIKINQDGTGEVSGILNINNLLKIISFSYTTEQIEKIVNDYHLSFNPPFYLKGRASVTDNKVNLQAQKVEIGRLTIPDNLVNQNLPFIGRFIEDRLNSIPNLQIRSFNLDGGTANLDATYPQTEFLKEIND